MPDVVQEQAQVAREVAIDRLHAHQQECCRLLGLDQDLSEEQQRVLSPSLLMQALDLQRTTFDANVRSVSRPQRNCLQAV